MHAGENSTLPFIVNRSIEVKRLNRDLQPDYHVQDSTMQDQVILMDTFEHPVRKRGDLLFQNDNSLFYISRTGKYEQTKPQRWSFFADLPKGPVKTQLLNLKTGRAFLSIASVDLKETHYAVLDTNQKTCARCRIYTFAKERQNFSIGFLRRMRGYDSAFQCFQRALQSQGALFNEEKSYIDLLFTFDAFIYSDKPVLPFSPSEEIFGSTTLIISTFLNVARQNEDGIIFDYDSEFLHDYRVSLRKIRSVLTLFKGVFGPADIVYLKNEFRSLMKMTNRLRDLDVYLQEKEVYTCMVLDSMKKGLDVLFKLLSDYRQNEWQQVKSRLTSKEYQTRMEILQRKFELKGEFGRGAGADTPTLEFAKRLITKRFKKIRRLSAELDDRAPDEEWHALRIQCKKGRYLLELFMSLFPEDQMKSLIKSMKKATDHLGRFNDFAVQQRFLRAFLESASLSKAEMMELAQTIGALVTLLRERQNRERRQSLSSLAYFHRPQTIQSFDALFAQEESE